MNTTDAIKTRRSIRKYLPTPIDNQQIKELLNLAMCAPSAANEQIWHFIVISEREILDKIPQISPHAQMCREAPLAILVCADISKEIAKDYWPQDLSAATQNLLLGAHDQGLGAVWTGIYPRKERIEGIKKIISLPDNIIPFSLVVLGHPNEKPPMKEHFLESKIHYNSW